MDRATAVWIASWRYEPPYDVYNADPDHVEEDVAYFLDPASGYYKILDAAGNILGFASFGPDGQVPGGDYSAEALDLGIGLAPELTGRGLGTEIVRAMLAFARQQFGPVTVFRTTVARFNERSQRVCEKLGFTVRQQITAGSGQPFVIMQRDE